MAARNAFVFVLLFLLVPVNGVLLYKAVALISLWAVLSLAMGRFPPALTRGDGLVAYSCILFALVIFGVDLVLNGSDASLTHATRLLVFLSPFFLIQRMRVLRSDRVLDYVYLGAAVGGTLVLPVVLVEHFGLSAPRVAGFARNAGPFSILVLMNFGLACLFFRANRPAIELVLSAVGAAGSLLAVFLTGMRGAWPALLVIVPIVAWARRDDLRAVWQRQGGIAKIAILGAFLVTLAALVVAAGPAIVDRVALLKSNYTLLDRDPNAITSLNVRLDLYRAALLTIAERPWFGWGISGQWQAVAPHLTPQIIGQDSFNHMHNAILTVAVDAGLLGVAALFLVLAAPLVVAWRSRRARAGDDRLAFATILLASFVIPGMTNVMFFHPILDGLWVLCVSTLCAATPTQRAIRTGEGQAEP